MGFKRSRTYVVERKKESEIFESDENGDEFKSDDSINTNEHWTGKGIRKKMI